MEFQVSYFGYIEKLKEEMLNSRGDIERTVERWAFLLQCGLNFQISLPIPLSKTRVTLYSSPNKILHIMKQSLNYIILNN